ncbi:proline-serine-threonine phosphatase interacting protein [Bulinus truncatus]|nr:proline-serine-threonine phosphatase interacting protein [Bulinus truncatus]
MPSWEKMSQKSYENMFWGGDLSSTKGYEALVKRNYESKKMLNDLEEYLKKRSKLESDYSKSLSSLGRSFKQREDFGVLEVTLNLLKTDLDSMANFHSKAANSLNQHAESVKKFKEDQTNRRKEYEESLNKIQISKLTQLNKTVQSEKTYVKKCSYRDTTQATFKETSNSQQAQVKDIERAKSRFSKATEEAERADNQYKSAVMVLEESHKLWEHEMLTVCQSIQDLDEERIKFMRQEIQDTVNIDSQLALDIDRSCEAVREVMEKCDVASDIQAFISKYSTGETRPEPFTYKHYTKIQNNDSSGSDSSNPYSTIAEEDAFSNKFFGSFKKKI